MKEEGYEVHVISEEEMHALISSQYHAMFEIIKSCHDNTQAKKGIEKQCGFFRIGWKEIYGI